MLHACIYIFSPRLTSLYKSALTGDLHAWFVVGLALYRHFVAY